MSHGISRQFVSQNDSEHKKWDQAIKDASALLLKVESRAARLKGAIKTFTELRDLGAEFSAPARAEEI